jgi:hypothetical protein
MEGVVDNRLKSICLYPDTNVTAGVENDCLFSACASAVASLESMPRGMTKVIRGGEHGVNVERREFTWSNGVYERKKYHVHDVQGLRELCSDPIG